MNPIRAMFEAIFTIVVGIISLALDFCLWLACVLITIILGVLPALIIISIIVFLLAWSAGVTIPIPFK